MIKNKLFFKSIFFTVCIAFISFTSALSLSADEIMTSFRKKLDGAAADELVEKYGASDPKQVQSALETLFKEYAVKVTGWGPRDEDQALNANLKRLAKIVEGKSQSPLSLPVSPHGFKDIFVEIVKKVAQDKTQGTKKTIYAQAIWSCANDLLEIFGMFVIPVTDDVKEAFILATKSYHADLARIERDIKGQYIDYNPDTRRKELREKYELHFGNIKNQLSSNVAGLDLSAGPLYALGALGALGCIAAVAITVKLIQKYRSKKSTLVKAKQKPKQKIEGESQEKKEEEKKEEEEREEEEREEEEEDENNSKKSSKNSKKLRKTQKSKKQS